MTNIEQIEHDINNFLLRDIVFFINEDKIVKKGKLILFKFKEFHLNFTLKNEKGDHKVYEIPYPYDYKVGDKCIRFSYDIDDFTLPHSTLYFKVKVMDTSNAGKMYNNVLVLSAL